MLVKINKGGGWNKGIFGQLEVSDNSKMKERKEMKKAASIMGFFLCMVLSMFTAGRRVGAEEAEPVKLVVATYLTESDGLETNIWYKYSQKYTELHPNVTFEIFTTDSDSYNDKVLTMLAGGDQVDIFWPHTIPNYVNFIKNGYVHELNSFAEAEGMDIHEAFDGIEESITYSDGKIYAYPFSQHVWSIYYNKDIFDQLGVEYPHNDMTWEEYGELMEKVTYGEGASKVYGGHFQDWPACVQNISIASTIHTVVEPDVDYSFMEYAYDMVLGWQDKGCIMDYATISSNNLSYHSLFINQNIATMYMGTWETANLIANAEKGTLNFDWGICNAPYNAVEGGQPGNCVGSVNLVCMNSNTKYPQEAYDFLKWVATSEDAAKIAVGAGETPITVTDEVVEALMQSSGVPEEIGQAFDKTTFVLETPMDDAAQDAETILVDEHSLIMTGNLTVEEGLAEATSRMAEVRLE